MILIMCVMKMIMIIMDISNVLVMTNVLLM